MKILYGVVGEGMGHATRSSVVLRHLLAAGHEVQVVVSGRAAEYLSRQFPGVKRIEGMSMAFEDNALDLGGTIWKFIKSLPTMLQDNFQQFISLGEQFSPDAVISDFESFSYLFGRHHQLPVISIDNMQIINRCALEVDVPDEDSREFKTAKAFVKSKLPGVFHYLITTFFYPPLRKDRTSLHPPILRQEVLKAERRQGDHLLVYQTTTTNQTLFEVLEALGVPCRVYGFNKDEQRGAITLKSFSEGGFVRDLAQSRGVLASGGFSLMGEAIYLGKPMLAVPLDGQFEQLLNSLYLEHLGYGMCCKELSIEAARRFMQNLDDYAQTLSGYSQDGNTQLLAALDELLAQVESGEVEVSTLG
jgi:uncharacterized protein (TIGR00661 family)